MEIVFAVIVALFIGFLIDAGVVWLLCWGLNAIGIHSICGWNVTFSWPLVVVFVIITCVLSGIFKGSKSNKG